MGWGIIECNKIGEGHKISAHDPREWAIYIRKPIQEKEKVILIGTWSTVLLSHFLAKPPSLGRVPRGDTPHVNRQGASTIFRG